MSSPLKVILVAAGNRSMIYSKYALKEPDKMQIVGVVEPNEIRRKSAQEQYGISEDMCFATVEELCARGKIADAVINGTMDRLHVPTSLPLLKAGYDILLEKPFCVNNDEMQLLHETAKQYGRKVMICHVLRYAPFYRAVKDVILSGELGDIYSIQLNEHVNYTHTDAAYVRGKWASDIDCGTPMLLAKSCHDMDLMMWLMDGSTPVSVSSYGNEFIFAKEKKPPMAGTRCLVDCPIEKDCVYSARRQYVETLTRWCGYVWVTDEKEGVNILNSTPDLTKEEMIESLKTHNPFGKCVWECKRDTNVDHQSVMVNFDNGAVGTFNMIGGTAKSERNIHIIGTKGELKGVFDQSKFVISKICPEEISGYAEEVIDLNISGDMSGEHGGHGGGDLRLVADFVELIQGGEPSVSCTSLEKSMLSHKTVFCAEIARKENRIVSMK